VVKDLVAGPTTDFRTEEIAGKAREWEFFAERRHSDGYVPRTFCTAKNLSFHDGGQNVPKRTADKMSAHHTVHKSGFLPSPPG